MEPNKEMNDRIARVFRLAVENTRRVKGLVEAKLGVSESEEWFRECPDCKDQKNRLDFPATVKASRPELTLEWRRCDECSARHLLAMSNVPKNLLGCALENWIPNSPEDAVVLQKVREFDALVTGTLILHSDEFGNGKTHLAIGLMRESVWREESAWFVTQSEFLRSLRERYTNHALPDVVGWAKKVSLLVLDDFGLSVGGKDELPTLHEVLNERYGEKLPTVITTNLSKDDFKISIGPRMVNRLHESTLAWLSLRGPGMRPKKRNDYLQG